MKTGCSGTLGLLVPDMTNPFFPSLSQAAARACRDQGYGMLLVDTGGEEALEHAALTMLKGLAVDGIVWFPILDKDTLDGVLAGTLTVVLDRRVAGYDNWSSGVRSARHPPSVSIGKPTLASQTCR